jgi:rfaE bifunctional protein kinase chain/domain
MKVLAKTLKSFTDKKVLVLGDIMLDHYIWGSVDRISPEAPVPVLDVQKEDFRLGGAANVALNLKALGAQVYLCGVIGSDDAGKTVKNLLDAKGIESAAIIVDKKRPTTRKTRIGANNQQIVRIDHENRIDITTKLEKEVMTKLNSLVTEIDAIIIEDYNKGLMTEAVITQTIKSAQKHNVLVTVDPKQKNFFMFKGVDVFKPNYSEMQKNLGLIFETEAEFDKQAKLLKAKLQCKNLVVTRGEKGLYIFSDNSMVHNIPTFAREVYDVSGAGDTVISVLTLALCAGCDIQTAAIIANHAAGVVCGKMGTATTTIEEIKQSYNEQK